MPEQITDSDILLYLAEHLPDDILEELFPDATPESIRKALRRISGRPQTMATKPAVRKTSTPDRVPATPLLNRERNSCMLYTDGAARGNPGKAGAGIVLLDECGRELAGRSIYLGICTNNVAEYQALIAGLELGLEYGCKILNIFLDSELIVRQINGQYRVKHPQLQPLSEKVHSLLEEFAGWQIRHVPRTENARADELANLGIDRRQQEIGADA